MKKAEDQRTQRWGMRNRIIYRAKILKTEDYCGIPRVSTPPNLGNSWNVTVACKTPLKIHETRPPRRFLSHQIVMPGIGPLGDGILSDSPDHAPRILLRSREKNSIRLIIFASNNEKLFSFSIESFYSTDTF